MKAEETWLVSAKEGWHMIGVVGAWVIYNLQSKEWESMTNMKHK